MNCCGVLVVASVPCDATSSLTSGSAMIRVISASNLLTTGCGICAGPTTPHHEIDSYGNPDSSTVGTLGRVGKRCLPVVASARNLPPCTLGSADGMLSTMNETWPPTRSICACELPLYGMCSTSMPATLLKYSPARC